MADRTYADRTYIATFDVLDPTTDFITLKQAIKESSHVQGWWNHLSGVFLVTSDLDADGVSELLRPHTHKARFLVVAVKLAQSEGALSEQAWDWIVRRSGQDVVA